MHPFPLAAMAAVPEALSARPKNTRTYGKARADAVVPIEDRLAALDNASLKDLSLRHSQDSITSPPRSPDSDIGRFTYGWKARLEAIDAGEEDDDPPSLDYKPQPFRLSSPTSASSTNTPHNKRVQSPSRSASSSPVSAPAHPLDTPPSLPDLAFSRKRSRDMDAGPVIAASALDTISSSLHNISSSIYPTSRGMDAPGDPGLDQSDDDPPKKGEKGKKPKKLTKKVLIETQKESARLKAAKNVSLRGSGFAPKARPISNLLEILQHLVIPQAHT
ncbi:hypothetical protein BS47DRAFT_824991 [Hydnum rufescens UP504]|uniref:Uncharacterized protein n=1 Tax=Hydnum rufescens UP504 TaxID=1448309 RepID=A0A9P6AZT7_9AGAM|nr:hypothetical protein BS47DRAFT_824991 [Hydnum rufescens UP504]